MINVKKENKMQENNGKKFLVEYLREKPKNGEGKGRPFGCAAAAKWVTSKGREFIVVSCSRYNKKKETRSFSKEIGRNIAINRNFKYAKDCLTEDGKYIEEYIEESILEAMGDKYLKSLYKRCRKYFKCDDIVVF